MFGDDPFEHGWIALAVPRSFGIHDGDGPPFADAKAISLGAENTTLLRKIQLFQAALQEVPRGKPTLLVTTLRRGLIAAEEDVPPRRGHANVCGSGTLGFAQPRRHPSCGVRPAGPAATQRSYPDELSCFRCRR